MKIDGFQNIYNNLNLKDNKIDKVSRDFESIFFSKVFTFNPGFEKKESDMFFDVLKNAFFTELSQKASIGLARYIIDRLENKK